MMYLRFVSSIFILMSSSLFGATVSVRHLCDSEFMLQYQETVSPSMTAGDLTVKALRAEVVEFQGSEMGIRSINGSPTGDDAFELISDTEMRAYGWCYTVDGIEPSVYPHEIVLKENSKVEWFFGFASYKNGEWVSMCEKTYVSKPSFICGD